MAKYRVVEPFTDLQDNNYIYRRGDEFPRAGADVSITRLTFLSSSDNRFGHPLIELVPEAAPVAKEKPAKTAPAAKKKTAEAAPAAEKPKRTSKKGTKK